MKVAIEDIVKKVGVSISTVSLVLNDRSCHIAQQTRGTIRDIVRQYNYKIDQTTGSLVTKKSNTPGLIVPGIKNLSFSALCRRIKKYFRELEYALVVVNSSDHAADDDMLIDLLISGGVDSLSIAVSNESSQDETIHKKLASLSTPYMTIGRMCPDLNCSKVYFDNESSVYMAIEKPVKSGHKRIVCTGISSASKTGASRVAGYRRAMQQFQLEVHEDYALDGNYRSQGRYTCAKQLMKTGVTAAPTCSDMTTLGVMCYFRGHHVRIPQDISTVSYDNTLNRSTLDTEIISVGQNVGLLAKTSCNELLARPRDPTHHQQDICLKPQLIEKDSVRIV